MRENEDKKVEKKEGGLLPVKIYTYSCLLFHRLSEKYKKYKCTHSQKKDGDNGTDCREYEKFCYCAGMAVTSSHQHDISV